MTFHAPSDNRLDLEPLDLVLESADLAHKVGSLVGGDGSGNDCASNAAGTAECHLRGDVDVGNVLVLAEEREVEKNGQGRSVGSEDDDFGDTAIQRLGALVGALLQLAVVRRLLHEIEDFLRKGLSYCH